MSAGNDESGSSSVKGGTGARGKRSGGFDADNDVLEGRLPNVFALDGE